MKDKSQLEAKLKEKIIEFKKIIISGEEKMIKIFNKVYVENNSSNFNYSQSYFLYKEREKIISEIKTLSWALEKDVSLNLYDYLTSDFSNSSTYIYSDVIYIETFGGLGDCLMMTPALNSLKLLNPNVKIYIYCKNISHHEILKNNPNIDCFIDDQMLNEIKEKLVCIDIYNLFPSLIYPKKVSEIICQIFKTKYLGDNLDIYLQDEEILWGKDFISKFQNPICINPTSVCSKNQEWELHKWEELVEIVSSKGFSFIQIGKADENYINGCIDLRSKFSIRQCIAILNASKGFIGVDSFWQHAASALNIPAIVLFGDSSPSIWGHDNNINIYRGYECSPCFEILYGQICPFSKRCMNDISVNEVLNKIGLLLLKIE